MVNYCFNCKNLIKKDDKYCIECGVKLKEASTLINISQEVLSESKSPDQVSTKNEISNLIVKEELDITKADGNIDEDIIENMDDTDDDEEKGEILVESRLSNIVLVCGIFSVLFLSWSIFWWVYIRNGNPDLVTDLDELIVFCSASLILGMVTIMLGNRDLLKIKIVKSNQRGLNRSFAGIVLGAFSVGITAALILIRWILFAK